MVAASIWDFAQIFFEGTATNPTSSPTARHKPTRETWKSTGK